MIKYTFAALILCVLIASCTADSYRKVRFKRLIGKYQYDAGRSYGGKQFADSLGLDTFCIYLDADATFHTNKRVPFMADTCGKWNAGTAHFESWNYLYYRSWDLSKYKIDDGEQFGGGLYDSTKIGIPAPNTTSDPNPYFYFNKVN